jgi:hypothetical protein
VGAGWTCDAFLSVDALRKASGALESFEELHAFLEVHVANISQRLRIKVAGIISGVELEDDLHPNLGTEVDWLALGSLGSRAQETHALLIVTSAHALQLFDA